MQIYLGTHEYIKCKCREHLLRYQTVGNGAAELVMNKVV
jgi:hypothetical protein